MTNLNKIRHRLQSPSLENVRSGLALADVFPDAFQQELFHGIMIANQGRPILPSWIQHCPHGGFIAMSAVCMFAERKIDKMNELSLLCFSGMQMEILPDKVRFLTSLEHLDLSWNRLQTLPSSISQLTRLRLLKLYQNQLTAIPDLSKLENLRDLNLWQNHLTSIPETIGNLTQLDVLNLSNNQFTSVPDFVSRMRVMSKFTMRYNPIVRFPRDMLSLSVDDSQWKKHSDDILQMENLQILSLRWDKIAELPSEIKRLRCLRSLDLRSNALTKLPDEISLLTNREVLLLDQNPISHLPIGMGRLPQLRHLSVGRTQLQGLPREVLQIAGLQTLSTTDDQVELRESIRSAGFAHLLG